MGGQKPSRNRVIVPARQATQHGGIGSSESILGLLKTLKFELSLPTSILSAGHRVRAGPFLNLHVCSLQQVFFYAKYIFVDLPFFFVECG
jgi:hypothetical protein